MAEKYCCSSCFEDPGLTRNIIPKVVSDYPGSVRKGRCDYCGTTDTTVVRPALLSQWFEMVLDCYRSVPDGVSIVSCLKNDWRLFGHPKMDEAHAKELLSDILDDGEFVRREYEPIEMLVQETPQRWEDLRAEMMHRNRWFLDDPIDLDRLGELLQHLIVSTDDLAPFWFRAKLTASESPFSIDEMGAPPQKLAGHGRANPAGIRYLYLGSESQTSVAEIRPHTGQSASVATFELRSAQVIDLRAPRSNVSPFIMDSAEQIARVRGGLPLLERLGEELTKPVQSHSAAFEYIPSQYSCEFIKKRGYRGVVYNSSVSEGINLALFDPDLATPVKVSVVHVDRVSVEISDIDVTA